MGISLSGGMAGAGKTTLLLPKTCLVFTNWRESIACKRLGPLGTGCCVCVLNGNGIDRSGLKSIGAVSEQDGSGLLLFGAAGLVSSENNCTHTENPLFCSFSK